ncbi:hypothetical protein PVAP13_9NG754077 [Panicum virgatum]|uniref:Uncharacterized protein n=1 Tax=Panicum virgatum TaxID=38727 RepID=A0A8T0N942_PANVG|nr:hypothetical protein PVAP13_9NG754077 [Panicum virgatum]
MGVPRLRSRPPVCKPKPNGGVEKKKGRKITTTISTSTRGPLPSPASRQALAHRLDPRLRLVSHHRPRRFAPPIRPPNRPSRLRTPPTATTTSHSHAAGRPAVPTGGRGAER